MTPAQTPKQRAAPAPVRALYQCGQSVWLDYIRRCIIQSGELRRLVEEEGIRGVTSNPAIFEKAIAGSPDYDGAIYNSAIYDGAFQSLLTSGYREPIVVYELLAVADIQSAADILRPVYESSRYQDGYVSLEVSPYLAHDTEQTLEEARRLWQVVDRPNLMIKIPATSAGIPAIQQLIGEGINVNVTLLFSRRAYAEVAEAYLTGLESLMAAGGDLSRVASVASFFVSRLDVVVDECLDKVSQVGEDTRKQAMAESLKGEIAIANAKLAYQSYQALCESSRWRILALQGAQPQRLLWASTGTKNPRYSDVLYVEELIGPHTINTMPPATLAAFQDHGRVRPSLLANVDDADAALKDLALLGISLDNIADDLLAKAVQGFIEAFDSLLDAVKEKLADL
ncbi:MAG: transaldolase [Cyanobacteria bacterium P01_A01_bin.114]